jgi:hypothetical protein
MGERTYFAPGLRSNKDEIQKEFEQAGSEKVIADIFGTLTGIGAVIDRNRQIVFANEDFLALLGIKSLEPILGRRTGEAISCIHSEDEAGGCGTTKACAYCGAVNAILESQKTGMKCARETRITSVIDGKLRSWDLNITSSPISLSGNTFYILILQDISDVKRRFALERIFFHDILNAAGGLNGLLTILKEGTDTEEAHELINLSEEVSRDIIDEIILQRQIREAEFGDLQVKIEKINSVELLTSIIGKIKAHEAGHNKQVIIADHSVETDFETDKILFQRVLLNLLKNALESTPVHGSVYTGVETRDDKIRFWVKNDEVISPEVQLQLFQRSFSTKGHNRGIGTYSIKLLTENYLRGRVSFISNESERTVFNVDLNRYWIRGNI